MPGPSTARHICLLAGLVNECSNSLSSSEQDLLKARDAYEDLAVNTALLINNVAAMGGEEAVDHLTRDANLVRRLATWVDNAHDASTLQRLTGARLNPKP